MKPDDSVSVIKGVGDKTAAAFSRLGVSTVGDLLRFYPRTYVTYKEPVDISAVRVGERQSVRVFISSRPEIKKLRGLTLVVVYAKDYSGTIKLTWFNCPFLRNYFHLGQELVFVGDVSYKNGMMTMSHPEYYTPDKYAGLGASLQPIYTVTAGITTKAVRKAVCGAMEAAGELRDYLPEDICDRYGIMKIGEAVRSIHFPDDEEMLRKAIKRAAFDEFYVFIEGLHRIKDDTAFVANECRIECDDRVREFIEGLSFKLTNAQMNTVRDMLSDMASDHTMNRLVQGDVGSGKTIVAAVGLFAAAACGYQSVIMAPTEVLAAQHYKELAGLFEPYGIRTGLLTGSMTAKEKRLVREKIKNHAVDVVVGTHALIQDSVDYDKLGLVVTDEQHRFGVKQRERLSEKGGHPHTLVMSATPIPRTLAIIMYGDLDISVIDELPAGRIPIKNCVVDESYRNTAQGFIMREVNRGHQVYVVCPMVEASEAMDDVANVTEYTEELKTALKRAYGVSVSVECLHGRMKPDEKNGILEAFGRGDISILVSTTVIEVGINNPNATVMMVENAERFGLAQLHQLRGRVGRGKLQSYCIFMSGKKDRDTMKRLEVLKASNDGFYIAGEDLKLRGPGDFFGIRQSGEMMFRVGDIYNHADMLRDAQEIYRLYGAKIDTSASKIVENRLYSSPVL